MSSAAVMIGTLRVYVEFLIRYVFGANSAVFLEQQNHLRSDENENDNRNILKIIINVPTYLYPSLMAK